MTRSKQQLWERFQKYYSEFPSIELALDISRMNFDEEFLRNMEPRLQEAFKAMAELEKGAIANVDEHRMVGHYWLRNPSLAPTREIRREIEDTISAIQSFAAKVHSGEIAGDNGTFKNILLIGIGGSALGPQFVSRALSNPTKDKLRLFCFDNTDPDGMERVLAEIGDDLARTLCVVISKSGGTKETRNGMLEAKAAYERKGLNFSKSAVAVTQNGSELDKFAVENKWIKRFPMWEWIGGRTSELSAVGLLPAALQGFDIGALLNGAKACDEITRIPNFRSNPSAQLALMWFYSGNGKGEKNMVVLPYKDRLELFSKYLQQLVMESLGKARNLEGKEVHQGISVFGNKGSTDQHAYVQQLREGQNNFFVTFIQVLKDSDGDSFLEVEPKVTPGDYLIGFLLGTREALFEADRESLTITVRRVSEFSIGVLIALFERAVGFYASLIGINAYHQPGVEAGKKAASSVIALQLKILEVLDQFGKSGAIISDLAEKCGVPQDSETIFRICEHLAANPSRGIKKSAAESINQIRYSKN
jgi:glucose-6-phosphate isomerase